MKRQEFERGNGLEAGYAALSRNDWSLARDCFTTALEERESAEALEGLGTAAWGLSDTTLTFQARERAYTLYRERHDYPGAARVAAQLAMDAFYGRGETAIARAWLQRARRLLEGPASAELGWVTIAEALITGWVEHDFSRVQALAVEASALGSAWGDVDLEMLALACEGLALVGQGKIHEGMQRLDEATLAAVTGELTDADAACTACCCLIFACEWTRDYERAAQWIERLRGLAARMAHPTQFFFCQTHYAGLLVSQGAWAEAEAQLEATIQNLERTQPALAAEALVRLADLRCRQGRLDAAATLFERASVPPFRALAGDYCLLGRAGMALAQDDCERAIELAERFLRAVPQTNRMERFSGLELLLMALVAKGDATRAEEVLADLHATTAIVATKPMRATASFAAGMVALARGDSLMAKQCLEDAVELWARSSAPYETAQARLALAQALLAQGRHTAAAEQARLAQGLLQRLGATLDAARAGELIGAIEAASSGKTAPASIAELTPRECEVLRLIAMGQSNQSIAVELVLSVRTVERHISNIYNKLGVSGSTARAAAAAHAVEHGLGSTSQRPLG
jgi:LuxR family transcriptional regulator, maltose regulon positive regulatory protein